LLLLAVGLTAVTPARASAQATAPLTVLSNANLRTGPSSSRSVIRVLPAGEHAVLLSAHTQHDYLYVASGADTGWVYSPLVELAAESAPVAEAPTPPAPTTPAPVATVPSAYHNCALDGNPSANGPNVAALRLLNQQKNRWHAPTDADIDPTFTLSHLLQPGNDDTRFNDAKAGEIEGWVVNVKVGGVETVNCRATDPLFRDTHIEVADRMGAPETERVIVEVTPRWRAAMQAAGADWTTQGLQGLIGKRVRFRGWQLFDTEHRSQARNTAPNNPRDWRATVWELHPVTSFVVTSP
jgi:uncharacterized protein YraI